MRRLLYSYYRSSVADPQSMLRFGLLNKPSIVKAKLPKHNR